MQLGWGAEEGADAGEVVEDEAGCWGSCVSDEVDLSLRCPAQVRCVIKARDALVGVLFYGFECDGLTIGLWRPLLSSLFLGWGGVEWVGGGGPPGGSDRWQVEFHAGSHIQQNVEHDRILYL